MVLKSFFGNKKKEEKSTINEKPRKILFSRERVRRNFDIQNKKNIEFIVKNKIADEANSNTSEVENSKKHLLNKPDTTNKLDTAEKEIIPKDINNQIGKYQNIKKEIQDIVEQAYAGYILCTLYPYKIEAYDYPVKKFDLFCLKLKTIFSEIESGLKTSPVSLITPFGDNYILYSIFVKEKSLTVLLHKDQINIGLINTLIKEKLFELIGKTLK